jgi:peptidoglycan/xylan/chitin deacetylase (PgdA/CDA1 family)
MIPTKAKLTRFGLESLYFSGAQHLFAPTWSGAGVIFTLHHVRPKIHRSEFSPNEILEVTPDFLESVILSVRNAGYEFISMDELQRRLVERDFRKKFASFTLDDGYLDNYQYAFPLLQKYDVPFTVYLNTGMPDGSAILWWWLLEFIVREHSKIEFSFDEQELKLTCETPEQKYQAFNQIYWLLRGMPHDKQYTAIFNLFDHYSVDAKEFCRASTMTWEMIKELSDSGLGTIGAHTVNHFALSKLPDEEVRSEAKASRDIITKKTKTTPKHFSYPYGDPSSAAKREFEIIEDLDFATATTTRKGLLYPQHAQHLFALPRVSLNGHYQKQRYIKLFLSGAPFALWNRFQRINVN